MEPTNKVKHKAILLISHCDIHPILETGECDGRPLSKEELERYNLTFPFLVEIEGYDKNDCLTKLKQKLVDLQS